MLATASAQVCVPLGHSSLYLALKRGFLPLKWGRWTLGGISPLGINLPLKDVFGCRESPASPYLLSWRSVQGTKKKKRKKACLGWTFHPTPKRRPFTYTFRFVHVGWGHRRNHPCQVSSQSVHQFRLPMRSKFTISHRLGEWLLQQCYALTCYTVICKIVLKLKHQ